MQKIGDRGTESPLLLSHLESPSAVSLYFHIPFCSRKCPYCHFFVLPDHIRFKEPLLRSLHREWSLRKQQLKDKKIVSIYFGGGTPTKIDPSAFAALLDVMAQEAVIDPDCEITLEVNPEDVVYDRMLAYKQAGINRLSLGIQSLIEEELAILHRQHTARQAIHAIHQCHTAGFNNISIDLMFDLPSQTLTRSKQTLTQLQTLPIPHLSLYTPTIEPHTVFFKKRAQLEPRLAPEEDRLSMLQYAITHLESIGLKRYEISAFAHPGRHSRHNTGYWLGRPFFGLGPSAFSYWDNKRFSNHAHFQRYIDALNSQVFPVDFEECLPYPRNLHELLAVQLRLLEGVHLPTFQAAHGLLPKETHLILENLASRNWLTWTKECWRLTDEGMLFYDSLAAEIVG